MKPHKLPYEEFKRIYNKVPRLCVDLIIKSNEGILLTKREISPFKGYWHIPGGTVLLGKKIYQTINRVAGEETGLKVKVKKLLGVMEFPITKANRHTISLCFLLGIVGGKIHGSYQAKEVRFFKTMPDKIIKEQGKFLIGNNLL
jgi:ADP-ribose pyrophosphatase YjhB (NUDIX family)